MYDNFEELWLGICISVYLNGSLTADQKMRSFIGFIVYAENSVKSYANGHFVPEDFPAGVEAVNCSNLQVSKARLHMHGYSLVGAVSKWENMRGVLFSANDTTYIGVRFAELLHKTTFIQFQTWVKILVPWLWIYNIWHI